MHTQKLTHIHIHTHTHLWSKSHIRAFECTVPIICPSQRPAMDNLDIGDRDEGVSGALRHLLEFIRYMATIHPDRDYLPYDHTTAADLPIIPRVKARKNQGDPSWMINTGHWLWSKWTGMKTRCFDPKSNEYFLYGGKPRSGPMCDYSYTGKYPFAYNIVACLQFTIMVECILGRPTTPDDSLDKVSNTQGYLATNLKWSNKKEQSRNRGTYKYRYTEEAMPRLAHVSFKTNHNPRVPTGNQRHRGRIVEMSKPKTMNAKIKRMYQLALLKHPRKRSQQAANHSPNRAKRIIREKASATRISKDIIARTTFTTSKRMLSQYSPDTTITHTINPGNF